MTDDNREASYRAYEESVSNAWKDPLPLASSVQFSGDDGAFLMAVTAWHERDDIVPLLNFVKSDRPLSDEIRRNLAGLIEILHVRSRPRRSGNPGGKHLRWQDPTYVATYLAEDLLNRWRQETGKRRVPAKKTEEIVEAIISQTKNWAMMRGEPPLDPERMKTLLRESKDRRL